MARGERTLFEQAQAIARITGWPFPEPVVAVEAQPALSWEQELSAVPAGAVRARGAAPAEANPPRRVPWRELSGIESAEGPRACAPARAEARASSPPRSFENWKKLIAGSKFKSMPGFGTYQKGKIGLQDHGNMVWYRNVMIRKL